MYDSQLQVDRFEINKKMFPFCHSKYDTGYRLNGSYLFHLNQTVLKKYKR